MNVGFGFLGYALGLLSSALPPVPGVLLTAGSWAQSMWNMLYAFDTWLPVSTVVACALAVSATWLVTIVLEATRTVISYMTFGGGAK